MPRQSLVEYFQPDSRPAREIAVVWKRGYRTYRLTFRELLQAAHRFSFAIRSRGVVRGYRVILWGENSGDWVAAFLGCILQCAVAVPMDAIAEKSFAQRVVDQAGVKLVLADQDRPRLERVSCTIFLDDFTNPWTGLKKLSGQSSNNASR